MKILDDISSQIVEDYKSGNSERRIILQTIKAALLVKQKDQKGVLSDEDAIKILRLELKQREEAKNQYNSAGRDDLVEKIEKEIAQIKKMLPEEISSEQIEKIVKGTVESAQEKNFGPLMGEIMSKLGPNADGKTVAQILKKYL